MSDLLQSNLTNFHFSGSGEVVSPLSHDFLAKLQVTLWSVLTYENCEQVGFTIVDGKQRSVISKVSFEELKRKDKLIEVQRGETFQEIPLSFTVLGKTVVLQLIGLTQALDRGNMKRIQRLFKNLEPSLFADTPSIQVEESQKKFLTESDAKYQNLLENMLHAVVYHDRTGMITYANPAAERILGLTHDQIFGKTSTDSDWRAVYENGREFLGEDHPAMQVLKTGKAVKNVVMGIQPGKAKKTTWILINAIPEFVDTTTEVSQVLVTFSDITQIKAIERKIEEKAAVLRSIIESSTESIWAVNTQLKLRYANSKFVKFCQNSIGETIGIGDPILNFVQQEKRDFWRELYQKAFEGEFLEVNDTYQTKKGIEHYRVNINPVFSAGKIIGASVFAMNVTELEQSMLTIKRQNERFREISWLQSHVIRAPLARLMGLVDLLIDDFDGAQLDQSSLLEKMKKASHEIDKVIREISHKSEDLI